MAIIDLANHDVFDDATHHFNELTKRWKNRLTSQGNSRVEQYENGRISVICDLAITPSHFVSSYSPSADNPRLDNVLIASVVFNSDAMDHVHMHYWEQDPVLVDNVQIVQGPQGIIPSLVRLYDIHDEIADISGCLMYQSAIDGRYKFIPRLTERKSSVVVVSVKPSKYDLINQNIQSSLKVMQSIADDQSKVSRVRHHARYLDLKHIVSCIRICLDKERVNCTINQEIAAGVKIQDVLIGPLDL